MYTAESVLAQIEQLWRQADDWGDYVQALQSALCTKPKQVEPLPLLLLPGLCCQAAGGKSKCAVGVAAAWTCLYTAAHILDDVEDGDIDEDIPTATNVATGLILTAFRALCDEEQSQVLGRVLLETVRDFSAVILAMCGSQHADLAEANPSLERCWKMVEAKSGSWFALPCRTGARLAETSEQIVECYSRFGYHLGILLQINDDLQGIWGPAGSASDLQRGKRTVPIVYALTAAPPELRERLLQALHAASQDRALTGVAQNLLEETGARLYLSIQAQQHYRQAEAALRAANPLAAPRDQLLELLNRTMRS